MWLCLCCQINNDSHMLSKTQGVRNCTVIGVLEAHWDVGGAASAEGGAREGGDTVRAVRTLWPCSSCRRDKICVS